MGDVKKQCKTSTMAISDKVRYGVREIGQNGIATAMRNGMIGTTG